MFEKSFVYFGYLLTAVVFLFLFCFLYIINWKQHKTHPQTGYVIKIQMQTQKYFLNTTGTAAAAATDDDDYSNNTCIVYTTTILSRMITRGTLCIKIYNTTSTKCFKTNY